MLNCWLMLDLVLNLTASCRDRRRNAKGIPSPAAGVIKDADRKSNITRHIAIDAN
jgi:hypothetical protein